MSWITLPPTNGITKYSQKLKKSINTFQNCAGCRLHDDDDVLLITAMDFEVWLVNLATELKGLSTSAVVEVEDLATPARVDVFDFDVFSWSQTTITSH